VPELRPTNKKKDLDDKLKLNNKNTRDIKPKTGRQAFDNKKTMNTRVQAKNVVNNNNFKPKNTTGQNFQSNNKPQIRRTLMHSGKKEVPQGRYQNNFKKPDGPRENYNMANKQPNMDNQHHTKNLI